MLISGTSDVRSEVAPASSPLANLWPCPRLSSGASPVRLANLLSATCAWRPKLCTLLPTRMPILASSRFLLTGRDLRNFGAGYPNYPEKVDCWLWPGLLHNVLGEGHPNGRKAHTAVKERRESGAQAVSSSLVLNSTRCIEMPITPFLRRRQFSL